MTDLLKLGKKNDSSRSMLVGIFVAIFVLAAIFRCGILHTPSISNHLLRPYYRCINYAIAAKNIRNTDSCVVGAVQKENAYTEFKKSGLLLPPAPSTIPKLAVDEVPLPFVDEIGYLLLTLGLAKVTGQISYYNPIYLQIFISSVFASFISLIAFRISKSFCFALLIGVAIACNPLEAMVSVLPDLPIWAWYAACGSFFVSYLAIKSKEHSTTIDLIFCVLLGLLVGFCVSIRLPSLIFPAVVFILCIFYWRLISKRRIATFFVAMIVALIAVKSFDFGVPTVGRSAFWHTLLGGMSEFGDIEGLAWRDDIIDEYIQSRHEEVLPLTPEYSAAAKQEYFSLVEQRPWLPFQVSMKRLANFAVAYRPSKNGILLIIAFAFLKLFAIAGFVFSYRKLEHPQKAMMVFCLGLGLANIFAHVLIVPLLEIYILPCLIILILFAAIAAIMLLDKGIRMSRKSIAR